MLSPTGPLPPQIYWRRRALALAVVVLAVLAVVWIVLALTGGPPPEPAAQRSPLTPAATTSTTTAPPATSPPASTATGPSGTPPMSPASTAAPAPLATSAPSPTVPAPASASVPATSKAAAAPPLACIDSSISVVAQVAKPSYPVGQQPVFRILIGNVSKTPCARDLNAALQSVTVFTADGSTRLWSSNDCYPEKSTDVPTLAPGEVKTFSVKWSGTTSEPTCTADRARVPAGQYRVVVTLGKLASKPVLFTLT